MIYSCYTYLDENLLRIQAVLKKNGLRRPSKNWVDVYMYSALCTASCSQSWPSTQKRLGAIQLLHDSRQEVSSRKSKIKYAINHYTIGAKEVSEIGARVVSQPVRW